VVVNHVENYCQTFSMAGVDEAPEAVGSPVGVLNGEGIGTVVAPVPGARELSYRHYLDSRDTQVFEVIQVRVESIEGTLGSKGAYMQLVDEIVAERDAAPVLIRPGEAGIDDFRGAVDIFRLVSGGGVGPLLVAVQAVEISGSRAGVFDQAAIVSFWLGIQGNDALPGSHDADFDLPAKWSPNPEAASAVPLGYGTQIERFFHGSGISLVFHEDHGEGGKSENQRVRSSM
jgi:hypothetical protein